MLLGLLSSQHSLVVVRPNEASVDSGLAAQGHPIGLSKTNYYQRSYLLEHQGIFLDSRDSGSTREELHEPKEVGMFTWLLRKQNPMWGSTGLQKETWTELEDRKTQERDRSLEEDR